MKMLWAFFMLIILIEIFNDLQEFIMIENKKKPEEKFSSGFFRSSTKC